MTNVLDKVYSQIIGIVQRRLFRTPSRLSVVAFLILIFAGAALLTLEISAKTENLNWIDALFTATSASCVTGLSVINIHDSLSLFGQLVLLALIQVGGLGIMTISTVLILIAGGKASFAERNLIQDTYTHSASRGPGAILKDVFILTFVMEMAGAALLMIRFCPVYGFKTGTYYAVFHSISAFCNAGFALFPGGSLEVFRDDILVNLVISSLIVAGGLGFLVISELKDNPPFTKRRWNRISLHSKLVIVTTLALIVTGAAMVLFMEWKNTLSGMTVSRKIIASIFQSITLRTAGFNTIPIYRMANETLFISIIFMFIGASPGSCGGGVKTSTVATLFFLGYSRMTGNQNTTAFNRAIPDQTVTKAANMVMISILVVGFATILLLMTEVGRVSYMESMGKFLEILYETVSAFGTVGLSMGITDKLTEAGRLIISLVMFTGRLGPLIIALAISRQSTKHFTYAHEDIMVG
jgi:trk system potassium uptake protein TrkH